MSNNTSMRTLQIRDKVDQLLNEIDSLLNITLPFVDVKFDLKGRTAGQAIVKNGQYSIRLNIDMINDDRFDHIYNDTIIHEVCHIVGFYTRAFKNHDNGWKSLCKRLGGTGERCHSLETTYARTVKQYLYETTCGNKVKVSAIRHSKIQKGKSYTLKSTGGKLIPDSYQLVKS